ncbi:cold and drought-regulated protein CORA-like [Hyalella azteca]|uniref:Cold and drought-regulated protein CORA-like n=1 Tax=Hyalella azteca TaxID=294128 RepID=A0A8B7PL04_HYAAZ|nr:cold and drought-regulated protein CORA-like [Hyalella azteca]
MKVVVLLLVGVAGCQAAAGFFDGFGGGKDKGKGESPKHVYYVVHNPIYVQQKPKAYGHGGGGYGHGGGGYGGHGGGGYGHGGGGYGGGHFITYETAGGYGHHDTGYHRSDNLDEYEQTHEVPHVPKERTSGYGDDVVKKAAEYEYIGGHSGAFHVMDYGGDKGKNGRK